MYKYSCVVNKADTLVAYETDNEVVDQVLFALVVENKETGNKISVLLNVNDSRLLCQQLHDFVENNLDAPPNSV